MSCLSLPARLPDFRGYDYDTMDPGIHAFEWTRQGAIDEVGLNGGAVMLDVVETSVDEWIKQGK